MPHARRRGRICRPYRARGRWPEREAGADAIAVACPLCHTNLDARQFQMKMADSMPVLYFTQLLAIALGLPEKDAVLGKNLVDPRPLLFAKGMIGTS